MKVLRVVIPQRPMARVDIRLTIGSETHTMSERYAEWTGALRAEAVGWLAGARGSCARDLEGTSFIYTKVTCF